MSDGTARIRLKIGQLEVEYEGRESFLQDDLFNLMQKVVSFYAEHQATIPPDPPPAKKDDASSAGSMDDLDYSTNTIAAHLNATTGPELTIAACAHLALVKKKASFSRKELLDEMKNATTYYNANMSGNMTKILDQLVKSKRINQVSKGTYTLSASEKQTLEAKLAQSL